VLISFKSNDLLADSSWTDYDEKQKGNMTVQNNVNDYIHAFAHVDATEVR